LFSLVLAEAGVPEVEEVVVQVQVPAEIRHVALVRGDQLGNISRKYRQMRQQNELKRYFGGGDVCVSGETSACALMTPTSILGDCPQVDLCVRLCDIKKEAEFCTIEVTMSLYLVAMSL